MANAFSTGTATLLGVGVGDTVTVNGLLYSAVSGTAIEGQFDIDGDDDANAIELRNAVNTDTRSGTIGTVSATASTNVVTFTTDVLGVAGDATTLAETGTTITISGAVFTGGVDADTATVNGLVYTAIDVPKAGDNTLFDISGSDTADASDLADSITNDVRAGITVPTAVLVITSAVAVVTINGAGAIGNLVDISGTANITASGATLSDVDVGAHTILIEGLDTNFNEITETIALNGTTVVPTVRAYLRINRMIVTLAGTDGQNNGIITATAQTDSTVTAQIGIGNNQTNMCIYAVPAGKTAFIVNISVTVGKLLESEIDSQLVVRPENQVFQVKLNIGANSTGSSTSQHFFKPYLPVTEKSDIKIQASTSTDSTAVTAGFDLILVGN